MTRTPSHRLATPRQREVFTTLLDTFLSEGLEWFTVDAAASRLHCSKSTLYTLGSTGDDIVRRVLVTFFKEVTRRTERALDVHSDPLNSLLAYFSAMGIAMEPASPKFIQDATRVPAARAVYDTNTAAATATITALVRAGVESGQFRAAPVTFVADLISASMRHIQQGPAGGLTASRAYAELGRLIVDGLATDH